MRENYYDNNRKYEFKTEVLSSNSNSSGNFLIELDGTYFYPEGGGQPADKGTIDGIKVLDVQKIDDKIIHTISENPQNKIVTCVIDHKNRDHYMVQHTGQHLISAVLKHELNIDTLSVHLGEIESKIEVNKATISKDEIEKLENIVNNYISSGKKIIYHETNDEGLQAFNIRRESKYSGYIRVVEIEDYDSVPCGGVHLSNLYELGIIKVTGYEKIRGHIRLTFLIGKNALLDYKKKSDIIAIINSELSTKTDEITTGINNLKKSISELKTEKRDLANGYSKLIIENLLLESPLFKVFENTPKSLTQKVATELAGTLKKPMLIINSSEKVNWYLIDSVDKIIDFKNFKENLLPIINGKGGGRDTLWQGSGDLENLDQLLDKFKLLFSI